MNPKYPHRHWSVGQRIALVMVIVFGLIAGAAGLFVYIDMQENGSVAVQGASQVVAQGAGVENKKFVANEPFFSLELPADWKEVRRADTTTERSITWQATKKNEANRSLKLYIDVIPANVAVNKILPVNVVGERLTPADISDNCIGFTSGSTTDVNKAAGIKDTPAKWMGVDFICDMDNIIDNVIGVGSTAGLNKIAVKGSAKGTHTYFFVYADRNIHPDNSILREALTSFKAK